MNLLSVRIQEDICCGFGNCAQVCPAVFALNYATNRAKIIQSQPTRLDSELLVRAAHECPTQAIIVFKVDDI